MSKYIQIQESKPSHYESIASIYNEHIKLGTATMDEELKSSNDINNWVTNFSNREKIYVIVKENTLIGWGIIKRYSDREGYRYACETAIYLTGNETGKGYGSEMKKHLIEQCKLMDYHHMIAKIFAGNTASIEYNKKLGYTTVGTQKEIGFRNGEWLDVVIMQLILR